MTELANAYFTAPNFGNVSGRGKNGREYKGVSANCFLKNYCVLDLETTSAMVLDTEIIEISAIKVRNQKVVEEFSTLINPRCHIPADATAVNNITDEMVSEAPVLNDVIDDFIEFIGEDVIVGYNNASFDMTILYDAIEQLRGVYFNNNYIDILHAVRRSFSGLDDYRLATVCKYYNLDTEGEHRALKDCYLTKECYERMNADFGDEAFKNKFSSYQTRIKFSDKTLAMQELQEMLEECLRDGMISPEELDILAEWLAGYREYQNDYPFCKIVDVLACVKEAVFEEDNQKLLLDVFKEVVDPVKANSEQLDDIDFAEKRICVTGDFENLSRKEVEQLITEAGAEVAKSVTKKLNYLVVGSKGSENWKTGNYGSKVQKAIELNEKYSQKGVNIAIIEEELFMKAIKNQQMSFCFEDNTQLTSDSEKNESKELFDWTVPVQAMLDKLIVEKELPEKSLNLLPNISKKDGSITSYSVSIYEPEYPKLPNTAMDPTKNAIVLNIQHLKKVTKNKVTSSIESQKLEFLCDTDMLAEIGLPDECETKQVKTDDRITKVYIDRNSDALCGFIKAITEYKLLNYVSKATKFACCSRFNECSDAKHCVHPNKLYACACYYKRNLDNGRIFYGKNRNVD